MLEKEKRIDDIKAEFELREKRLKLVYKILYVAVALWAALFVAYTTTEKSVLPLYCGFLSALTAAILNILYYIFGELRCMKICTPPSEECKEDADRKFMEIWDTFAISVFVVVALSLLNALFPAFISAVLIGVTIVVMSILLAVNTLYIKGKANLIIRNASTPVLCYAFFAVAQIVEVSVNA